jgi:hypothetical protein
MPPLKKVTILTPAHYSAIGLVAANWSALERLTDSAIWRVAKIPTDEAGACITAQIFTMEGKLKALIALLRVRNVSKAAVADLNKFADDMRGLGEQRNRVVHDPWVGDVPYGNPHRFQMTAQRTLVMDYTPMPTTEVTAVAERISDAVDRFDVIIRTAISELEPSPEKSP